MKSPARWLIALALLACALAWWWNRPPPEPRVQNQPLSQWLRTTDRGNVALVVQQVRSLGAPAVTWLAYAAEHGRTGDNERGIIAKIFAKIRGRKSAPQSPASYNERNSAIGILGELGAAATPAIPALLRVLDGDSFDPVQRAAIALHKIGPDSWPVVEDRLSHGSNLARCELLNTISLRFSTKYGGPSDDDVTKVMTLLTNALHDSEPNIRRNAASSLNHVISIDVLIAIPGVLVDQAAGALWPLSDESNLEVRHAKQALQWYYRQSKVAAIPRLTVLLTDPDETKQNFARAILDELGTPSTKAEAP